MRSLTQSTTVGINVSEHSKSREKSLSLCIEAFAFGPGDEQGALSTCVHTSIKVPIVLIICVVSCRIDGKYGVNQPHATTKTRIVSKVSLVLRAYKRIPTFLVGQVP